MSDAALECLNSHEDGCEGAVEYRMSTSPTGRSFPRCDKHWTVHLERVRGIQQRYGSTAPPADFDPLYAGEQWDED